MEAIGKFFVSSIVLVLTVFLRGWAFSVLWGWFVVKQFDLPAISIPLAIGISLIVSYLTYDTAQALQRQREDKREWSEKTMESFVVGVIAPPIFVGFGWIYQLFL